MTSHQKLRWRIAGSILFAFQIAAGTQDPASPDFRPEEFGLDPTPLVNEAMGLSFYCPRDANISVAQTGTGTHIILEDGELRTTGLPIWQISIRATGLPAASAEVLADQLLTQFRSDNPEMVVLQNDPFDLGGRDGRLLYLESNEEVGGYLIAPTGEGRFIVFRIGTQQEVLDEVQRILLPMFRTVRVTSAEDIRAQREAQMALAALALQSFTPERLQSIVGTSQWYRIYQPTRTGNRADETEVGYFQLEVREGKRGETNPDRDEASFSAGEHENGLLVIMTARYLESVERGIVSDVQIRFWLTWDRTEEVWLARATRRQGEASRTDGEMGVRTPPELGYSKLEVVRNSIETMEREEMSFVIEEPYLTQAEVYLLGSLLPRDGSIAGDMSFHFYDSSLQATQRLPLRVDSWTRATDGSGNWRLESRLRPDFPPIVSTFDQDGNLVRREKEDGTITEPMAVEQLLDLWRRKGLPTD